MLICFTYYLYYSIWFYMQLAFFIIKLTITKHILTTKITQCDLKSWSYIFPLINKTRKLPVEQT